MHISLLPEDVLGKILSLLPTKLAASTSVLSKNWRNVFALVHNLAFDNEYVSLHPEDDKQERDVIKESFRSFVDRTLALQCASPIKKFSLKYHIDEESEMDYVCGWLCNAVERGVLELNVSINALYVPVVLSDLCWLENVETHGERFLPPELFTSKTLVKLTLGKQVILGKLPPDVFLPALKFLFIDSVSFECYDLCKVLLPSCPVLEELSVRHEKEYIGLPFYISSQSIKKLSLCHVSESETNCMYGMSIDAPSLVSLDYSDHAMYEFSSVNLESLVEAKLNLHYTRKIVRPFISCLIIGISNVETLHLSSDAVNMIHQSVENNRLVLPVFNNLISLSFGSKYRRGWKLLPYLLKQSPKLETLIIQDFNGYTRDVSIPLNKVKTLCVLGYGGTVEELERLKNFIGETKCLELLQVVIAQGIVVDDDGLILETKKDLMTTLLGVSVSSTCKIEIS